MSGVKQHIIIAGGTGLVGQRLTHILRDQGYQVSILTRNSSLSTEEGFIHWDPGKHILDPQSIDGCMAIVNLAGAGVMSHSWSETYKKTIIQSRIDTNVCIEKALEDVKEKPVFVSASAIGIYGFAKSDHVFHENSPGALGDFLQEVTVKWEEAASQAAQFTQRHVTFRIGIVLSAEGGALSEMQNGFKFGIGSYFSPGDQIYSWIHIDDLCNMMMMAIQQPQMRGIYNAVAPKPVTAQVLATEIAQAKYGSSLVIPVPKFAAKLALGERHTVLTEGCFVSSKKIEEAGFRFEYHDIKTAMSNLMN